MYDEIVLTDHCVKSVRIRSFLVRIFPHSDWIGRNLGIAPYSILIRKNTPNMDTFYAVDVFYNRHEYLSTLDFLHLSVYFAWI